MTFDKGADLLGNVYVSYVGDDTILFRPVEVRDGSVDGYKAVYARTDALDTRGMQRSLSLSYCSMGPFELEMFHLMEPHSVMHVLDSFIGAMANAVDGAFLTGGDD